MFVFVALEEPDTGICTKVLGSVLAFISRRIWSGVAANVYSAACKTVSVKIRVVFLFSI
jgi:uncharacterized membrane protein